MVGVSTFAHTYVSGGTITNAAPVILKLSAGRFDEQLPMTLGKNFCIAGDVLRGSTIRPAEGLSNDGVTPNSRSTMFFVSDAVTIQGITMRGMEGFDYDVNDPFNTAKMQNKVGVGTTACGVYLRFNPDESVIKRSAYIKDCTCFGHNATDGSGHGGAIGVYLEGGVHHKNPEGKGYKSMVFDSFTNVMSGGVGIYLKMTLLLRLYPVSLTTVHSVTFQTLVQRFVPYQVTTLTVLMELLIVDSLLMK